MRFAAQMEAGGVMLWELGQDLPPSDERALLRAVSAAKPGKRGERLPTRSPLVAMAIKRERALEASVRSRSDRHGQVGAALKDDMINEEL